MAKHDIKFYNIDELCNHDFDDKELNHVLHKNVLMHSLIIGMFKHINSKKTPEQILEFCRTDNWFNKRTWSWKEHDDYVITIAKIYYNIFRYPKSSCVKSANDFILKYGFTIKDTKQNEAKHMKRILVTTF